MNFEVLYESSKEDIINYCRSIDDCNTSLSVICDKQQKMIRNLSKVARGFSDIINAEHEFDMAVRRKQRIEDLLLEKATHEDQDDITFRKVNNPPQEPQLDADTPTVSEALRSLGNAVEGCFG